MKVLSRRKLALIFGGRSTEHEISCLSAYNIARLVDTASWDLLLIGITREGAWLKADSIDDIADGSWTRSGIGAFISPDTGVGGAFLCYPDGRVEKVAVDVIFPVLHGIYGEDGTIQGLFEMSGVPYVGCGVLSSAAAMDKFYTKIIVGALGIRQARYVGVRRSELSDREETARRIREIEETLSYPVFVKPSRAGSSVGVTKAHDREELVAALLAAAEVDSKILVEEFISGRELECAVLRSGAGPTLATGVGEILAAAEFYDYEAKYHSSQSRTDTDPELPEGVADTVRDWAVRIFDALDGYGLSRVDFFLSDEGEVVFNEINTLPGFTSISMYPMLWEKSGLNKKELVAKLLESAFGRGEA